MSRQPLLIFVYPNFLWRRKENWLLVICSLFIAMIVWDCFYSGWCSLKYLKINIYISAKYWKLKEGKKSYI